MKSGFKDALADNSQKPQPKPKNGKNSPWDFRCPEYDERSSCFVNAGTKHGVGVNNPVGHTGKVKDRVPTLPYGRVQTMRVDEKA